MNEDVETVKVDVERPPVFFENFDLLRQSMLFRVDVLLQKVLQRKPLSVQL